MSDPDIIIVGAGIFGATIARALVAASHLVHVYDDSRPMSGSAPSGCLMKPSWFAGLGKDVHEPALAMLDELYGLKDLYFRVHPGLKRERVHWVPRERILSRHGFKLFAEQIVTVSEYGVEANTVFRPAKKAVIVAAGVWCTELLENTGVLPKQGVSFRWDNSQLGHNLIKPWAPYKQVVAFNETPSTVWGGDGTAILEKNWWEARLGQCEARVRMATGFGSPSHHVVGLRPYVKGVKPCLLEQRAPKLWLATGGAKNGTVAAGWCAHRLREELA